MKYRIQRQVPILFMVFVVLCFQSCRKFLEVGDPQNLVVANYAYNSDNSAILVVTDLFYDVQYSWAQGINGLSINLGASADELNVVPNSSPYGFYLNVGPEVHWSSFYSTIYKCNAAIEGLERSEKLSETVKTQLLGESKFMRAFAYFYLVNLFGDVPLLTSTDYATNSKAFRSRTDDIYIQIITDLKAARELLNENYVANDVKTSTNVKVRPNKAAATALLARTYLYTKDWRNAELMASELISNSNYELINDLDVVFLANSREAIWQLEPQSNDINNNLIKNCADARYFILDDLPNDRERPVWLSEHLEKEFESGDARKQKWVAETNFHYEPDVIDKRQFRFPVKYKVNSIGAPPTEYIMVLRIAEQYLIRAEARINNGKVAEGIEDLNLLRSKRSIGTLGALNGLPILSTTLNPDQAKLVIEHERQVELFTEWGHRWLDLKRTGRIDQVMSTLNPVKYPDPWISYHQLFTTPGGEMKLNKNLGPTKGYPN